MAMIPKFITDPFNIRQLIIPLDGRPSDGSDLLSAKITKFLLRGTCAGIANYFSFTCNSSLPNFALGMTTMIPSCILAQGVHLMGTAVVQIASCESDRVTLAWECGKLVVGYLAVIYHDLPEERRINGTADYCLIEYPSNALAAKCQK
ncbi:MAG: hypothetical protein JSR58_07505 [Verrucomicrobia bacterium]|nr:hypothetical protein [Verrucomicrobiota bacterium]